MVETTALTALLGLAGVLPQSAPAPEIAAPKELTVLVYKNAKNDLDNFGLMDMNEMERAGSGAGVNVVVEFGRIAQERSEKSWTGVRRYYVTRDGDPENITSPVLWEGNADMGDWRHLAEFLAWGKKNFPARRYLLVVWNHGNGWKRGHKPAAAQRGISFDDETGNHITTPELARALAQAGGVDLLALDACLMQTAEVAYEVRDYAPVVTASEETEPGEGYPYDVILNALNASPAMPAEEIGRLIVGAYKAANEAAYMNTTQSAVRTAALPRLLALLGEWAAMARREPDPFLLKYAMLNAQAFYDSDQKDIADVMKTVAGLGVRPELKAKSAEVMDYLTGRVVIASGVSGYQHARARGLAVYMPFKGMFNSDYSELAWAADGRWDEFISGEEGLW